MPASEARGQRLFGVAEGGCVMVSSRKNKPVARVAMAMARISRDKWLHPVEVRNCGESLSSCASKHSMWVMAKAIPHECLEVGMLRGLPPAFEFEPHYREAADALRKTKPCFYCDTRQTQVILKLIQLSEKSTLRGMYENYWRFAQSVG